MREVILVVWLVGIVFFGIVARAYYLKKVDEDKDWNSPVFESIIPFFILLWPGVLFGFPFYWMFEKASKLLKEWL